MGKNNNFPRGPDTNHLIESLVADLPNRSESKNWTLSYWSRWALAATVIGGVTWLASSQVPDLIRLPNDVWSPGFLARSGLWLGAFFVCARISFLLAIPLSKIKFARHFAALTAVGLAVTTAALAGTDGIFAEVPIELDMGKGPCGFFIALTGIIAGTFLLRSMRRAAPESASVSGAWTLAAAGCMSSFFMNLVCRHENPAHVLIWHMLPILILIILGTQLANKILTQKF